MRRLILKNHIREYRKVKGLTQKELAFRVGISKNALSCIERGIFEPSAYTAYKICAELGYYFDELFFVVPSEVESV